MSERYILAVDLGTTNCKTILLDPGGAIAHRVTREYPLLLPQAGWAEQDPQTWWRAVAESIRQITARIDPRAIVAISLSGQMHGLVLLDRGGGVLRPAILWNDQRSSPQCARIYELAGGPTGLLRHTNNAMLPGYTAGKILWVKEHEPHVFERAARVLLPKDYIRYRLTGEMATDVSDASGTGLFDVGRRAWADGLIDLLGIPRSWLPPCLESGQVAAVVSPAVAGELNLAPRTPVLAGGGDAVMQTVGSATVTSESALVVVGTGGNVTMSLPSYRDNPEGKLQMFCHVLPKQWVVLGVTLTAGSSLKWYRDTFGAPEVGVARSLDADPYDLLTREAARSPACAGGLIFLPYLLGERCPHADPSLRGTFFGLGLHTRASDIVRSILEGVTFSLREVLELIVSTGIDPRFIHSSGGGAKSELWRQIQADVFDREVRTLRYSEDASALGAGIVGGLALGFWGDIAEAIATIEVTTVNRPEPRASARYLQSYGLYRQLYRALKPSFDQLHQIAG